MHTSPVRWLVRSKRNMSQSTSMLAFGSLMARTSNGAAGMRLSASRRMAALDQEFWRPRHTRRSISSARSSVTTSLFSSTCSGESFTLRVFPPARAARRSSRRCFCSASRSLSAITALPKFMTDGMAASAAGARRWGVAKGCVGLAGGQFAAPGWRCRHGSAAQPGLPLRSNVDSFDVSAANGAYKSNGLR